MVDVVAGEDERPAEQDLIAGDGELPEAARGKRRVAPLQLTAGEGGGRANGQVAEILRVPQHHAPNHARMHVRLAHVRQRQAGHDHVGSARLTNGLGRARDGGRRDAHDQPHRRVHLEDRLCLGERAIAVAVAGPDRDQLQPGVLLRDPGLDEADPLVLIGRAQRRRDDRELARAADEPRRLVGERFANPLRRRLVHQEIARVGLRVGVPRQHLDPARSRFS